MNRTGNKYRFEANEEMVFGTGIKRFIIRPGKPESFPKLGFLASSPGMNQCIPLCFPNCYGYPMSLGEATTDCVVFVEEYGPGNPDYWTISNLLSGKQIIIRR